MKLSSTIARDSGVVLAVARKVTRILYLRTLDTGEDASVVRMGIRCVSGVFWFCCKPDELGGRGKQ